MSGVAVVGGASRGLGLLISRELAERGYRVHGYARDEAELERAREQLPEGGFVPHVCDTRSADEVTGFVDDVLAAEGRIDVAIHSSGIIQVGPAHSFTLGHYVDAVDTMLWGPVHLALAVMPSMTDRGAGRIGIVASIGGVVSVPRLLPYSVAKFGAVGLAEGLAAELAGTGVTATSVTPGLMRTGGHLHAEFAGDPEADYPWFAAGASLPGISIDAQVAARRIVDGVLAGKPVVELTPLAIIGRRVHGLAPALTVRAMGLAARVLPDGPRRDPRSLETPSTSGRTARGRVGSRLLDLVTTLGDRAAARHNETARPVGPPSSSTE